MPQLEKTSFLGQGFFLIFIFLSFYFLISLYVLPQVLVRGAITSYYLPKRYNGINKLGSVFRIVMNLKWKEYFLFLNLFFYDVFAKSSSQIVDKGLRNIKYFNFYASSGLQQVSFLKYTSFFFLVLPSSILNGFFDFSDLSFFVENSLGDSSFFFSNFLSFLGSLVVLMVDNYISLPVFLFLNFLGLFFLLTIDSKRVYLLKVFSLGWCVFLTFYSMFLIAGTTFLDKCFGFFFYDRYELSNFLGVTVSLGLDEVSVTYIVLIPIVTTTCILLGWENIGFEFQKYYLFLLMLLQFFLVAAFSVLDFLMFYILFEAALIPTFLLLAFGSRERKKLAAFKLYLYTLFGSVLLLVSIIVLMFAGCTEIVEALKDESFVNHEGMSLLWLLIFVGFMVKIPAVPLHNWLPEAHTESPTAGSVFLAAILLKLGGYAYYRFLLPVFPYVSLDVVSLVYIICGASVFMVVFITLRYFDIKKVIAFSSIVHLNISTIALFSGVVPGVVGGLTVMWAHAISTTALFLCIGILYDRFGTRSFFYLKDLRRTMPLFSYYLFFFILANVGLPGSFNFVGEFISCLYVYNGNAFAGLVCLTGVAVGSYFSFWLYNRVDTSVKDGYDPNIRISDLNKREHAILLPYLIFILVYGVFSDALISFYGEACYFQDIR